MTAKHGSSANSSHSFQALQSALLCMWLKSRAAAQARSRSPLGRCPLFAPLEATSVSIVTGTAVLCCHLRSLRLGAPGLGNACSSLLGLVAPCGVHSQNPTQVGAGTGMPRCKFHLCAPPGSIPGDSLDALHGATVPPSGSPCNASLTPARSQWPKVTKLQLQLLSRGKTCGPFSAAENS